jgi:hypothetical protein
MIGIPDLKKIHNPLFRKLNKAISKHQYEVTEYSPNGTFATKNVKIDDTKGRIGKEQFYELRYQSSWHLIGLDDFNTLFAEWEEKNNKFIEKCLQDHQTLVVELDHENTEVPTL